MNQIESDAKLYDLNTRLDDPALERKSEISSKLRFFRGVPMPSIVEISESGTCNRACSFCPRSAKGFVDRKEFIDPILVLKLAKELADCEYAGLILFSGFVEPMLDKAIASHIHVFRSHLPGCRIEMVTNGDPINISNLDKLHKAGLDALLVSCYDGPHQVELITDIVASSVMPIENVVFRNRWLGEDENFGISLSNRGGLMVDAEFSIGNLNKPLDVPCFYPSYTFFMDYTGEVLICAHDWGRKAVVGNVNDQTFLEIWTGKDFSRYRKALLNGNRGIKPCNVCNVQGTRMGSEHAMEWNNFEEK